VIVWHEAACQFPLRMVQAQTAQRWFNQRCHGLRFVDECDDEHIFHFLDSGCIL